VEGTVEAMGRKHKNQQKREGMSRTLRAGYAHCEAKEEGAGRAALRLGPGCYAK